MATITSLDFNVGSHWDGSGVAEARRDIDALRADLERIGSMRETATVNVAIDDSELTRFRAELDQVGAMHVTATATVTTDTSRLDALRAELTAVGSTHETATATVNTDTARLDALRIELTAVGNTHVAATATANVNAATLDAFQAQLARVAGTHVTATANANVNSTSLEAFDALLRRVGSTHVTATANANVNSASLDAFDAQLRRVGNTHVTASANANVNHATLDEFQAQLTRVGNMHETATANVNVNSANLDALQARLTAFGFSRYTSTADVNTDSAHMHLTGLGSDLGTTIRTMGELGVAAGGAGSAVGGMGSAAGGAGGALGGLSSAAGSAASGLGGMASTLGTVALYMTAVVALAPIAAASVVLIPVAFILAATTIIASNKKLQKSFMETFHDTLEAAIPLVMPVINALLKAFQQLDAWLKIIGPAIHEAFAAAAPLVQPLFNIIEKLVGGALPGFTLAMRGMTPLIEGLGQGALKLGGYLGQAANVLARIPGLGQAMNGIMGAAGQVILQVAKAIAQVVAVDHGQALIQMLQALSVLIKASVPLFQLWAATVTGVALIIRGLGDVIIALEVAWKAFMQLLNGTGPIVAAFTVAWNATWAALKVATLAVWKAFEVAWSATVNGLVIAWNTVSAALVVAWNAVWNGMKIAASAIWTAMTVAWTAFVNGLAVAWSATSSALSTAWNTVWNAMSTAAQAIWNALKVAWVAFVNALAAAWTATSSALSTAWNTVWNAMSTAANAIWNALKVAWSAFLSAMSTAWSAFASALTTAWNALWNALKTAGQAIWTAMQTAWTAFTNAMHTAFTAFASAMTTAWNAFWNALKTAAQAIWSAMQTAWNAFTNAMRTVFTAFANAFKAAWEALWTAIKGFAQSTWNVIKGAWDGFLNAMRAAGTAFANFFKSAWEGLWNAVKGFAVSTWNALRGAWDKFAGGFKAAVGDLVSGVKTIWKGIEDAFKAPIHFVVATVINGGIIKAIDWVISKLGGPAKAVPDVPVPFAEGGHVRGAGTGTSDSIPARLSDGEFVMKADAVRRIGVDRLYQMNNGSVPEGAAATLVGNLGGGFADGGLSIGDIESMFGDIIKSLGGAAAGILAKGISGAGNLAKAAGDTVQKGANAVGNAAGHVPVVGGAAKSIIKGIGHLFGGGGKKVSSATNAIADALDSWGKKEFDSAAGDLINKVFDKLPIPGGHGPLGIMGSEATRMMMKASANKIKGFIASFLFTKQQQQIAVTSSKVAGTKAVQAWAPTVLAALAMTGHPASWLGPILGMMSRESGGNPNAINRTDVNAQHGIPSQGLMQVIPPTFAANHQAGTSNNILDPLANIAAAINYIAKVPSRLGKTPYAAGTDNATAGMHLVGENGPEMVMFGGGEVVKTAGETALGSGGGTVDPDKLTKNLAAWQSYNNSLRASSENTWKGVRQNADSTWAQMQGAIAPFAQNMLRTVTESGSGIVANNKATWTATRNFSLATWNETSAASLKFNNDTQKQFADSGAAIQAKWKQDWTDNQTLVTKTWADEKAGATAFTNDLTKTYQETGTTLDANWKTALATNTTDTNTYWTSTKATYSAGSTWLTGTFFPPVNDLMVNKLPQSFATSVSNIGSGWLGLENASRNPVAAVVDVVYNKGIVGVWNLIAKAFGAPTLSTFTLPGFATGGAVQGAGTGTSDSVVARLSAGEHVMTASEVRAAGGHGAVARWRSSLGTGSARTYGNGDGRYAVGGAVVPPTTVGGNPSTPTTGGAGTATGGSGGTLGALAAATLGSIHQIANPLIVAAVAAGKTAIDSVSMAGSGMRAAAENMGSNMGKAATDYITANDIAPTFIMGGGSDASAQAWADSRVGEPYVLGGDFTNGIDCSEYQSGIARAILGQTPSPWFTTFAFNGATAPAGFVQNLQAPYMVGVTNVGVGHMSGTLNGTNYEATPPAVRKGPAARGWNDPMFSMHYGFQPSVQAATIGGVTSANHLAIIDGAMAAAAVPPPDTKPAWESGMNIIITHESGWNASAINLTDINAQNGIPSQGLAQVIPPTFAAYHVPGTSTNILDPIANVAAAINYIKHVYGSINNVPGVRSVNAGGAYLPYRNGTKSAHSGMAVVGEVGPEVMDLGGGGQRIHSFDDIMHKIGEVAGSNQTDSDWKAKLAECLKELKDQTGVSVNVPITVHGGGDAKEVVRQVEAELLPKLRMLLQQHTGRRSH